MTRTKKIILVGLTTAGLALGAAAAGSGGPAGTAAVFYHGTPPTVFYHG